MRLSTTALTAQVSFGAGTQTRFGALRPSEEKKVFKVLPPEVRVMELVGRYEELNRIPMGFETPKQRESRESQLPQVEQQLLGEIQNPGFSKKHAAALLLELYQKRDVLQQQLPEEIFNAIYKKATSPAPAQPQTEFDEAEDPVPDSIRRRMGQGASNRILIPGKDLEALLAAAASKGYGKG